MVQEGYTKRKNLGIRLTDLELESTKFNKELVWVLNIPKRKIGHFLHSHED